jgi:hypothetical protein
MASRRPPIQDLPRPWLLTALAGLRPAAVIDGLDRRAGTEPDDKVVELAAERQKRGLPPVAH